MLSDLLTRVPDEEAVLELLERFDRLLKKHARILNYEDAYNDLVLFFIELIQSAAIRNVSKKSDGMIVNYIVKSVRNHSQKLGRTRQPHAWPLSKLSEEQRYAVETKMSYTPDIPINYYWSPSVLTEAEENVLMMHYELGFSISDIAELTHKSRQSVNQTKIRALNKLRNELDKL